MARDRTEFMRVVTHRRVFNPPSTLSHESPQSRRIPVRLIGGDGAIGPFTSSGRRRSRNGSQAEFLPDGGEWPRVHVRFVA